MHNILLFDLVRNRLDKLIFLRLTRTLSHLGVRRMMHPPTNRAPFNILTPSLIYADHIHNQKMQHCVGGAAPRAKSDDSSRKTMAKRKYCSIPQYIQINNRELYDAMEDICPTLMGIFSMKSMGPNRPPKELTYLMPRPGSEMHKEIIGLAYGGEQLKAIDLIKSGLLYKHIARLDDFKQGDVIRTAAKSTVTVDTSGGFTKIGGAKIMADDNFEMLYTDAKFHVYLLESGIPMASVDNTSDTVSGGAWSSLHNEKKQNSELCSPAGLAKSALETHLGKLQTSAGVSSSMPSWISDSGATRVFSRWGVSLARFFAKHNHTELTALVHKIYHPNPMCVIPFTALFVPKQVFDAWLDDVDDDKNFDYVKDYLPLCPTESSVSESMAGGVINAAVASVLPNSSTGRRGSMGDSAKIIQDGYKAAYGQGPIRWNLKIVYDEALFIMNSYIRAALNKDWAKCKTLSGIIVSHYSSANATSWLLAADESRIEIQSGAMHCKLLECALSESMLYPNEYFKKNSRPAPVVESPEDSAKFTKLPAECRDFTKSIKEFFETNA